MRSNAARFAITALAAGGIGYGIGRSTTRTGSVETSSDTPRASVASDAATLAVPTRAADGAATLAVDLADWATPAAHAADAGAFDRLWTELARGHAAAGRTEDVLRVLAAARRAGGSVTAIEASLRGLSGPSRLRVTDALRTEFPDAGWTTPSLAYALLAANDLSRAYEPVLASLDTVPDHAPILARWLLSIDTARADRDLATRADEGALSVATLRAVADALVHHPDLHAAWERRHDDALARKEATAREANDRWVASRFAEAKRRAEANPRDVRIWVKFARVARDSGDQTAVATAVEHALGVDAYDFYALEILVSLDARAALPRVEAAARADRDVASGALWIDAALAAEDVDAAVEAALVVTPLAAHEGWEAGIARLRPAVVARELGARANGLRGAERDAILDAFEELGRTTEAAALLGSWIRSGDQHRLTRLASVDPAAARVVAEELRKEMYEGYRIEGLFEAAVRSGDLEEARRLVEPFAEESRGLSSAAVRRAWALARIDPAQHVDALRSMLAAGPDGMSAAASDREAFGDLLRGLGRIKEAREVYEAAFTQHPEEMSLRVKRLLVR